jgi:uncharacterized protein involved in outer membrane biogenesis
MKKWILIGSGAVVVIIIVLLIVGVSNLGPMIKNAVNTQGPKITKTDVRLGDVGVSIFSAEAKLKDFYLGNPKGFKSPQAMKVGAIYVDVDEKSLTGDAIIIEKIEVVAPEITYEKIRGTDNFKTILNNVKSSVGADKPSKGASEKEDEGRKIIIRNLIVRDGKVNLAIAALGGKSLSASLPDIHLKDIGKEKGGVSPAEAFKEAFAELHEKITSPSVNDTLNKGLKELGIGIKGLSEGTKKEMGKVTDKVKSLFGK